jgi:hypothetical protein
LTVRDVQDADDWLEELLAIEETSESGEIITKPRFPNLRHLSLFSTTMISFPSLPLHRLTHLDLSHNFLNSIPTSLSSLHSLQSLNLSNNMIVSVRNAPSALGNITTLNLSKNRIDCLVGLERLLGLERVDVRSNELYEVGEVGRLAVLPHIKEVWCSNNLFDQTGVDWRSDLGIAFAQEAKTVTVDDRPWTWQEKRTVDAAVAARGRTQSRPHSRNPSATAHSQPAGHHHHPHPQSQKPSPIQSSHQATNTAPQGNGHAGPSRGPSTHVSPTIAATSQSQASTPPSSTAVHKKRRPRRVITLDDDVQEEPAQTQEERIGGSLRLPAKTTTSKDNDSARGGGNGIGNASFTMPKKTAKRSVILSSTFDPPAGRQEGSQG